MFVKWIFKITFFTKIADFLGFYLNSCQKSLGRFLNIICSLKKKIRSGFTMFLGYLNYGYESLSGTKSNIKKREPLKIFFFKFKFSKKVNKFLAQNSRISCQNIFLTISWQKSSDVNAEFSSQ